MADLFICDTPFQVMSALLLAWGNLESSEIDCIVTDNMPGAAGVTKRLTRVVSVRDARAAHVKHTDSSRLANKMGYLHDLIMPFNLRWPDCPRERRYEALFVRNYSHPFAVSAYSYYARVNEDIRLKVYDEGYSTYSRRFWTPEAGMSALHVASGVLARRLGRRGTFEHIDSAYLYEPELLRLRLPFPVGRLLPNGFRIDGFMLKELNAVFGFERESDPIVSFIQGDSAAGRKYIYFEECFATDTGNQDDLKVVDAIARAVGKDRMLIKLHPRTVRDRFTPLGYTTVQSHGYPWEIVVLNLPADADVMLISLSSGSLLNYRFLCDRSIRSIFLYGLFPGLCHSLDDDERRFFEDCRKRSRGAIAIPTTHDELMEALHA